MELCIMTDTNVAEMKAGIFGGHRVFYKQINGEFHVLVRGSGCINSHAKTPSEFGIWINNYKARGNRR
jgi:hypothetical protein